MVKKFILPLFKVKFGFYIGESERHKFLELDCLRTSEERELFMREDAAGITNGTNIFISDINLLDTVVHELHHVTTNISNFVGIKDEETQAYIQQYMMNKYLHLWQSHN